MPRRRETRPSGIIRTEDIADVQRSLSEGEDQRRLTLDFTRRSDRLAMKQGLGHTQRTSDAESRR